MKKIVKILALCMLIIMVAMTFASCGLFSLDFDNVEERLEKKGYVVDTKEYRDDEMLIAYNDNDEYFRAITFKNKDDAKEAYKELKAGWGDVLDDAADIEKKVTYARKGCTVYYGTVQGVKDALYFPAKIFVFSKKR